MPDLIRRFESLLFNNETSSKDAYRGVEIKPRMRKVYRIKTTRPRPSPIPLKDLHALTPWRDPNVPFDLYHRPKEVLRTDPRKIQERYDPPQDVDRAKVQKSRPKVVMTPALDLDAVEEPYRQMFVDHIYTSVTAKALKDAVTRADLKGVRAPLSEVYAKCNPVSIEQAIYEPYVSPEWRMDSAMWDKRQMRTYTEPTKSFWLSREPNCAECKSTAMRKAMNKRRFL